MTNLCRYRLQRICEFSFHARDMLVSCSWQTWAWLERQRVSHFSMMCSNGYLDVECHAGESKNEPAAPSAGADVPDEAQSAWAQQVAMVRKLYPETLWDVLSPDLVLTFWSLCLSDIHFPAAR